VSYPTANAFIEAFNGRFQQASLNAAWDTGEGKKILDLETGQRSQVVRSKNS
jgi:hypothetical protein